MNKEIINRISLIMQKADQEALLMDVETEIMAEDTSSMVVD